MKPLLRPMIRDIKQVKEEMKRLSLQQPNFSRRGQEVNLNADTFTADHHDHFLLVPEVGSTDNLETIEGGSDGRRIVLYPRDSGNTFTLLTSDNIATSRVLAGQTDAVELVYSAALAKWIEPSFASIGGIVTSHSGLHYVVGHPSPPADNPIGEYFSIMFDIVGGAGVDESNNLLAMFNTIGALGGGKIIIRAENPTDPIRLNKLVSVYWSNMDIEFRSPVVLGALGGIRIMGELSTFIRNAANAGKLVSTAAEGTKIIPLDTGTGMQASDFLVGDQIIIRGQNDASGNALEKQVANVVAIDTGANEIELAQELEYDFEPTYPLSDWVPDHTTGTTIYIVHTVGLSTDAARGDMEAVGVTNFANAEVGTLYRISDGRNENEMNPSAIRGSLLPYENDSNMEFVRIVATDSGPSTVVFDRALSNDYISTTPYFGSLAKVLPVRNTHIRGVLASHLVDQTSKNAHVLSMGFAQDCSIEYCILDGQITPTTGRRGQAVRIADSYNCWGRFLYVYDPAHWESSEGYGCAHYKSTGGGYENCQAWGGRHNFLIQASVFFTLRNCQSWDDHISGFDLHGVNERDGILENCTGTRSNRSNPSDASNGEVFRYGNTSHTVGCHYITTTGCKVFGPVGANFGAFGIMPASSNLKFINLTVDGAYYCIKFTRNSLQCQPVQSVSDIIFQGVHLYNCVNRAVYIQCNPTYDGINTIGKLENATFKGVVTHNCVQHFHFDGQGGIIDLTISDCEVLSPITDPPNNFYAFNISGVTRPVLRVNNTNLASRGIQYDNCTGPIIIVQNTLTPLSNPLVDGGGNTGTLIIEANIPGGSIDIEGAQDAVGSILVDSASIDFTYTDATPSITAVVKPDGIAVAMIADQELKGFAGLTSAADTFGYFTDNLGAMASTGLSAFVRTLLDDANQAAFLATLGITGSQWVAVSGGIAYPSGNAGVNTGAATLIGTLQLGGGTASLIFGSDPAETGPYGIGILASGGGTVATKGTGWGRDFNINGGASNNTAGVGGGDIRLKPGVPTSPAIIYGDVYINEAGGTLYVSNDTDRHATIGRARVGGNSVLTDHAIFSHVDMALIGNYAIAQSAVGDLLINAASTKSVSFRINNTAIGSYTATAWTITPTLTVTGDVISNGSLVGRPSGTVGAIFVKDSNDILIRSSVYSNSAAHSTQLLMRRANGTEASPSSILNGDSVGIIGFSGYHTGGLYFQHAAIAVVVDAATAASTVPMAMVFYTGSTAAVERMRIGNTGLLTVNNDADIGAIFGRTRTGYGTLTDHAWVSHVDMVASGSYALIQNNAGETNINSADTQVINFRINNVMKMAMSATAFNVTPATTITGLLTGNGGVTTTDFITSGIFRLGGAPSTPQELGTLRFTGGSISNVVTAPSVDTLIADGTGDVTQFLGALVTIRVAGGSAERLTVVVGLEVNEAKTIHTNAGNTLTMAVNAGGAVLMNKSAGSWDVEYILWHI